MPEEPVAEQEQLVALLKDARAAIEEALTNLGEDLDDVSGFAQSGFTVHIGTTPQLASRMGVRFSADIAGNWDTSCIVVSCSGFANPGGDQMRSAL